MTPKEKANQIFDLMYLQQKTIELGANHRQYQNAKRCALITVDEIISAIRYIWGDSDSLERNIKFWKEVYKEIENI